MEIASIQWGALAASIHSSNVKSYILTKNKLYFIW